MKVIHAACALSLCIALLGSCASAPRATFTEVDEMATVTTGTHNIRYLADAPANTYKGARHAMVQQRRPFIYLALSGGGGGGAYGAGILNGWTQSGARPEFTTVFGVSKARRFIPSRTRYCSGARRLSRIPRDRPCMSS